MKHYCEPGCEQQHQCEGGLVREAEPMRGVDHRAPETNDGRIADSPGARPSEFLQVRTWIRINLKSEPCQKKKSKDARDSIVRSYRRSECVEGPCAQWYEFGND